MYPFVAKVHYWNDWDDEVNWKLEHTHVLVYGESFADAAARIEKHFGKNLEDLKLWCVGDAGQLFEVPGRIAEAFIVGCGDYRDGKANMKAREEDETE